MTEAVTREQVAYQAKELQLLLRHPAVQRAWEATEARIVAEWRKAPDLAAREAAWSKLHAFETLQRELRGQTNPALDRLHISEE